MHKLMMRSNKQFLNLVTPLLLVMILLMVVLPTANADSITLRDKVQVSEASVRLGDIAQLSGEEARRMADWQVHAFTDAGEHIIDVNALYAMLDKKMVNWGNVMLKGYASVKVTFKPKYPKAQQIVVNVPRKKSRTALSATHMPVVAASNPGNAVSLKELEAKAKAEMALREKAKQASKQLQAKPSSKDLAEAEAQVIPGSLRALVIDWLHQVNNIKQGDLRIDFRTRNKALDKVNSNVRYEFELKNKGYIGQVRLEVRVYEAFKQVDRHYLNLKVSQRADVLVAKSLLYRGQMLSTKDVEVKKVWIENMKAPLFDERQVLGHRLNRNVQSGDIVFHDDISKPIVVKRGELITIRSMQGKFVIKTVGRAREDGVIGQLIEVQNPAERNQRYFVKVTGPQEAIIKAGDGQVATR